MLEIIFIEIVSILSFLYSVFLFVIPFTSSQNMFYLFLWTAFSAIVYASLYKKHKLFNLSILLLILPLIYFTDMKARIFILSTSFIIFLYIRVSLLKGEYFVHKDQIKRSYLLYIPLVYLKTISSNFTMAIGDSIPFIIIYIFSSIIFLRTIRHLDSNMGIKTIRKNNIKNTLIISLIIPFIFSQNLRDLTQLLVGGILNIISYPVVISGRIIGAILEFIFGLNKELPPEEIIEEVLEEGLPMMPLEEMGELVTRESTNLSLIKTIFLVLFFILFIYIVYRIIIKSGSSTLEDIDYVEEREYIKDKKKRKPIFNRDRYPEDPLGRIRFYYRKFLKKIDKEGVEIEKTDSSLEINEKAVPVVEGNISRLRDLYIKSRYSDFQAKEEDVKEMEDLYKKL